MVLHTRQNLRRVVYAVYFAVYKAIHSNVIGVAVSVLVGMVVYAAALLLIKGLTEEELHSFPKGELIIRVAKKFHLL